MAVPIDGVLTLEGLAQEALYGTYGSGTITPPIHLYDLVNGGDSAGSGNSYPTVNENCQPNPASRNVVEIKQVYKKANTVVTGPFSQFFNLSSATSVSTLNANTVIYSDSNLSIVVGEFGTNNNLNYWYQDDSGLTATEKICGASNPGFDGTWNTTSNSTIINTYCGQ